MRDPCCRVTVATMTWLIAMEYLCRKWPRICSTCRTTSRSFPHWWVINGCATRLTGQVPLVEQELLTIPEHLRSPPVSTGVRVTRSLVVCLCFVDRWLSFFFWSLCYLSFDLRILITPLVYSNSSHRKRSYVEVNSIPIWTIRHIYMTA